jgi:hypothetical protein
MRGGLLDMRVRVECYSGRKAYERPSAFGSMIISGLSKRCLKAGTEPNDAFFRIRADDGIVYILRHDTSVADGSLVAFDNSTAG